MRTLALLGLFLLTIPGALSAQEVQTPPLPDDPGTVAQDAATDDAVPAQPPATTTEADGTVENAEETPQPEPAEPTEPNEETVEKAEVRETAPVKTIRPHKIPRGEVELARGLVLEYGGFYRHWINFMDEFPVDEDRNSSGQSLWGEHQLRVNPGIRFEDIQLSIKSQFDIFRGQLWGDTARFKHPDALRRRDRHDGADITEFDFRQLYLEWMSPAGLLRGGQMASNWGLGLVANDGEHDDDRFGQKHHGDLSERLMFVTAPFSLATEDPWAKELLVAVGADLTYRDENADLLDGDTAWGAVASVVYVNENYKGGGYFAYRNQEDDDGDTLEAFALDLYGDFKIEMGSPSYMLLVAFEGAYMMAHTDRVTNYEAPDGIDVKGFGAVGRLGVDFAEYGIVPMFEMGYASGDKNSYDETNYAFSFDPDYNVGMILFDEVMEAVSARGASLVYDPERSNQAPKGTEQLLSQGRVQNAMYVYPTLKIKPPKWGTTFKLGFLYARVAEEFQAPWPTFENGGSPTSYLGTMNPGKNLGFEINAGAGYTYDLGDLLRFEVNLDFAHFLPGDAFDGPSGLDMDPVSKISGRVGVLW